MLDRLSDIMLLGALEKCSVCKEGQLVFRSGVGYACTGDISEWTKCQERSDAPKRRDFKLPKEFKERHDFLKLYKFKQVQDRILQHNHSTVRQSSQESAASNGTNGSQKSGSLSSMPLKNLTFVLESKNIDKDGLKKEIEKMGGNVAKKVTETTAAVISDKGRKVKPIFLFYVKVHLYCNVTFP